MLMMQSASHQRSTAAQPGAEHELALPVLCFLASHRPLAFFASQCTYLLEPVLAILGLTTWCTVARRWSETVAGDRLETLLTANSLPTDLPVTAHKTHLQPSDVDQQG